MANKKKGTGGGGKLSRSETVTVRLDPKLRFAAELAARKHRRTLSSFIEWSVEQSVKQVVIGHKEGETAFEAIELAWDVDEPDRFSKLAFTFPHLLTHDEEVLWKLISESGYFWKGKYDYNGEWQWRVIEGDLMLERLREHWDTFKQVVSGELERTALPDIPKQDEKDIPF